MGRYIIISNLTDEGAKTLKKNPGRVKEVNAELKHGRKCPGSVRGLRKF